MAINYDSTLELVAAQLVDGLSRAKLNSSVATPRAMRQSAEVMIYRFPGGELVGHHAPSAALTKDIEDTIDEAPVDAQGRG